MNTREFSLKYGIDERLVKAVAIVESSGSGFNEDNSLKIRVEAQQKDIISFASLYNGNNVDYYSQRIKQEYNK